MGNALLKQIQRNFGKGSNLLEYKEKIHSDLTLEELAEVVEDTIRDGEMKEEVYEDFEILWEEKMWDGAGEGPHAFSWYNLDMVIINRKLGLLFVGQYFGGEDDTEDIEGDLYVYKVTEELESYLEEYEKEQEEIRKDNKKRAEILREEYKKEKEEEKRKQKAEDEEKKEIRKEFADILTEQGFKQCRSAKGNLISKYELEYFTYDSKNYLDAHDVIKEVEGVQSCPVTPLAAVQVVEKARRQVTVRVLGKAELKMVKAGTTKGIQRYVELYVDIQNERKAHFYLGSYVPQGILKKYKDSDLGLLDLIHEVSTEEIRLGNERRESFMNFMGQLMKDFG